jgi:hypothetical protein
MKIKLRGNYLMGLKSAAAKFTSILMTIGKGNELFKIPNCNE